MFRCIQTFPNWQDIRATLKDLADKKLKSNEIVKTITSFRGISQMARQHSVYKHNIESSLDALFLQYKHKLPDIYSKVANFLLARANMSVPLVVSGKNSKYTLTKEQVLYLFSTMVLCLIPQQQFDGSVKYRSRYHYLMDFSNIFEEFPEKTLAVMEYIDSEIENVESYDEKILIQRKVQERPLSEIIQQNEKEPMSLMKIEGDKTSIEEFYGQLKADFANQYIGGGSLTFGCVQEEIMFVNHPELWVTQMLCEVMEPNEAIQLSGFQKYFKNTGYGHSFAFDGRETHKYTFSKDKIANQYITAIDAVPYGKNIQKQFSKNDIDREIMKAYVGFNTDNPEIKSVVTGNWGCGAFGGDLRLKFLIQWLACSLAKKEMIYCPFGHSSTISHYELFDKMKKQTIGQNYHHLLKAAAEVIKGESQQKNEGTNIYQKLL